MARKSVDSLRFAPPENINLQKQWFAVFNVLMDGNYEEKSPSMCIIMYTCFSLLFIKSIFCVKLNHLIFIRCVCKHFMRQAKFGWKALSSEKSINSLLIVSKMSGGTDWCGPVISERVRVQTLNQFTLLYHYIGCEGFSPDYYSFPEK